MDELAAGLERLAADRTSGASAICEAAVRLLAMGLSTQADVLTLARRLVKAQPTMAPVWFAAIEAVAARDEPDRFERFAQRVRRAPSALTRVAVHALADEGASLHVVTLSYSGAVVRTITALVERAAVRVSCAEGRPALEGRRLAADVAATGIPVTLYTDAAIAQALGPAAVVLTGADAIGPDRFFNKVGTRMLAAAAGQQGVPVYLLATRDKFVDPLVLDRLEIREGHADEVWPDAPGGVQVSNSYFEAIPLDLVSAVITDAGAIGPADVPAVCSAMLDPAARQALTLLIEC